MLDLAYDRRDSYSNAGVVVHAGLGDGSFGAGLLLATNGSPQEFVVGDCDGDGDADLLVHESNAGGDYRNTLAWWRLEGGTFVPGPALEVDAETPLRLAPMDVDGDGITDGVAGTFSGYDVLQVFRTVDGAPTLLTTILLPAVLHNINQRQQAGDIDGDGDEDLLVVMEDLGASVFYLQPILCNGSGYTLQPLQVFANPTFERPFSRDGVLADWDADGDLDFVSPTLSWLENTGGASFTLAAAVPSGWSGNGNRSPLNVADTDGDGHLDALAHRLFWRGDGTFSTPTSVTSQAIQLGAWTRMEDWEGDGDLDLTGVHGLNLNNGDGSFTLHSTPVFIADAADTRIAGWDDFDGDGLRDVVVSSFTYPPFLFDRTWLFTGTQSGAYQLSTTEPAPVELPEGSISGDLDGDGDRDILATSGYWANDGAAHFGAAPVAAYFGVPELAEDLDGDQDLDLVVRRGPRRELLRNLGGLAFARTDFGSHTSGHRYSALDLDEDGDLDLVVVAPSSGVVDVHEMLAGGVLAPPLSLPAFGVSGTAGRIDVDGDGRLDLVVGRTGEINVSQLRLFSGWIRGDGLDYVARRDWACDDLPFAFGDFDGDGDGDALGATLFRNLRFDGAGAGGALQYGLDAATSGTGGWRPVLGTGAPVRPGTPARFAIGRGRGQASGFLLAGRGRADVQDSGYRRLVAAPYVVASFMLDGAAGAAGRGAGLVPLRVHPSLIGRTLAFQVVLIDPGASKGLSATNGLEVRVGDLPVVR